MSLGVAELNHEEVVRFDPARLEALCQERGDEGAERVIIEALSQSTQMLHAADTAWQAGDWTRLDVVTEAVGMLADRIGMMSLSDVAQDVRTCIANNNVAGVAATMMRMQRLGDNTSQAIWSIEGNSP